MRDEAREPTRFDRRALLRAACAGCAAIGLSACSRSRSTPRAAPTGPVVIAKLSDVPVGESASARGPAGQQLLLARPNAATVVAFSAICTHQGCTVEPAGKELGCPCHDAVFDAFTGQVLTGPAPRPLPAFPVRIVGTDVVAG